MPNHFTRISFILTTSEYYYPDFIGKEIQAQRIYVIYLRTQTVLKLELLIRAHS